MNKLVKAAEAGTLESSDVFVRIEPGGGRLDLTIESVVMMQYGEAIEAAVTETLADLGISDAKVFIRDRGALDCVIRARVETAACRAMEVTA